MKATILSVTCGVLAGVGSSLLMGTFADSEPETASARNEPVLADHAEAAARTRPSDVGRRLRRLEHNQRILEGELDDNREENPQASAPPAPETTDPPLPSEQEAADDLRRHFAAKQRQHESEPRDPEWADIAQASIRNELDDILAPQEGVNLTSVSCRTTSCTAVVEWDSFGRARKGYGSLLQAPFDLNCAPSIFLEEPETDGPHRATLMLDCEQARIDQFETG